MRKIDVRLAVLTMVLLLCLPLAAACTTPPQGGSDTTTNSATTNGPGTPADTSTSYTANVPSGLNYNDQPFRVYAYPKNVFVWSDYDWQCSEGPDGGVINDAVYKRSRFVEDQLGVKIEITHSSAYTNCNDLVTAITSGEDLYDIANVNCLLSFTLAESGHVTELNTMDTLDMTAPWWDANCVADLSINNKNFCLTGDIGTMYKRSISTILFNKSIFAQHTEFTNVYDLVREQKWTLEQMYTMSSDVADDLDGNGIRDASDKYGLVYFATMASTLPIAGGVRYATKNSNDVPEMTLYSERCVNLLNKSAQLLYDKTLSYNVTANNQDEKLMYDIFMSDRALFYYGELHSAEDMRGMDSDFGILPMPKYDEAQDSYYHTINANVAAVLVVPISNLNRDMTGYVLDTLGAESKNVLTPAYYERNLQGQISKDVESTISLDIIISTLRYDIGYLAVRPAGAMMRALNTSYSTDLASAYRRQMSSINKTLETLVESIGERYN